MLHINNVIVVVFTFDKNWFWLHAEVFALGIGAASFCDKCLVLSGNETFLNKRYSG